MDCPFCSKPCQGVACFNHGKNSIRVNANNTMPIIIVVPSKEAPELYVEGYSLGWNNDGKLTVWNWHATSNMIDDADIPICTPEEVDKLLERIMTNRAFT